MKHILVVLTLTEAQKADLEAPFSGKAVFTYIKNRDVTAADLQGVDGIIGNVSPDLIRQAPDLGFLQLNSAGADPYLKPGILPEGCTMHNAVGAYGRAVSEHMLALTFSLIRKFHMYGRDQFAHVWSDHGAVTSVEGSTVLILGVGDIGGSYARKVKALGAYVIGVRKNNHPKPDYLDEQVLLEDLDQVIGRADIVASVLPDTAETRNLFEQHRLAQMKTGAYLINCGRGSAVDLDALKESLDSGHLSGAGLDVTNPEPLPADHPLWDYDNVIITPHVAGGFHLQQTFDRILEIARNNLLTWIG